MKRLLILGIVLLAGLGGYFYFAFPSYTWHQKMTIEVEADGQIYSGSSVVRVHWRKNDPLGSVNGPAWIKTVKGEAPFVKIPSGSAVFALLNPPGDSSYAVNLAFRTLGYEVWRLPMDARYAAAEANKGKPLVVPRNLYPFLVTFRDATDPTSASQIDPGDLAKSYGAGVSLKRVVLEITNAPVTKRSIEKVLSWIDDPKLRKNPIWRNLPLLSQTAIRGLKR